MKLKNKLPQNLRNSPDTPWIFFYMYMASLLSALASLHFLWSMFEYCYFHQLDCSNIVVALLYKIGSRILDDRLERLLESYDEKYQGDNEK